MMSVALNTYDLGDVIRLASTFTDPNDGDALIDPTTVAVSVRDPNGDITTYTYDEEASSSSGDGLHIVIHDDVGEYHCNIDADIEGQWFYRWFSTGVAQAASEKCFVIRESKCT